MNKQELDKPKMEVPSVASPIAAPPIAPPPVMKVHDAAPRVKLDFLDGIRGLCAVYIAFYFPVLYTADLILRSQHTSFPVRFTVLFVGVVPLAVGISYLFHLAFERRFMSEFARPKQ